MPVDHGTRIVVNGRFLQQEITGVQRFALEVLQELSKIAEVTILAPRGELSIPATLEHVPIAQVGSGRGHFWEQASLPRELSRRGRPLLLNLASTGPIGYRNQVSTHHDITYVRYPESFSSKFRLLYKLLIPRLLKNSLAVITVSEFSKRELVAHYRLDAAKVSVVPNAVSAIFRAEGPTIEGAEPYLLAVSSPNTHKNFDLLIAAFCQADLHAFKSLLIIGSQSRSFRTSSFAADNRIRFLGRVDDPTLAAAYRGASAFVFPSLYEGFGIPPLEAQRCGTPVIAAYAASIPEVLRDSALYFSPASRDELISNLRRLEASSELRDELSTAGVKNADRYSWSASAMLVKNLLEEVAIP